MKRKELIFVDAVPHKECWVCKKILPLVQFWKVIGRPTGNYCCKQCHRKKYVIERQDKIKKRKLDNREKILQSYKEYHKRTESIRKIWCKEYNQRPEVKYMNRIKSSKRRRNLNVVSDGTVTVITTLQLMELQKWKCKLCGCCLRWIEYHLDHIIPLAKWWLNSIGNVQRLCKHCNLTKFIH